jgi:hypothetical protein
MAKQVEFMGRNFGDGHYISDKVGQGTLYSLIEQGSWELAAEILGYSEACPVVPTVIERKGAKGAAETYAELLLTRGIQLDIIRAHNPTMADKIMATANRRDQEPPGQFNPGSVPDDHEHLLRGPASLVGYNLPRLTREFIGTRDDRSQERILQAFEVFETVVRKSTLHQHNPMQFMVALAEQYALIDNNPKRYLKCLLSDGKVQEDNLWHHAMLTLVNAGAMETILYHTYIDMTPEEQSAREIAVLANKG